MLDDRDRRLLALLQSDADTPLSALAEAVSLSVSACSRRIARLAEEGYIARRVARLDRHRIGLPTTVYVLLKTGRHDGEWLEKFRRAVTDIPEVVEVHRLTGNVDYIMKVVLPNVEHYDSVYKRLIHRIELFDVSAYISMESVKSDAPLPTDHA